MIQPPPVLDPWADTVGWWHRTGQLIDAAELRVGGATLHPSHRIAHFGNNQHRLVFCLQCGGLTTGTRSELLAEHCRRRLGATRARQLRRMCLQGRWPTAAQQQSCGRADLSTAIRFIPVGSSFRIAQASGAMGLAAEPGYLAERIGQATPPAASGASTASAGPGDRAADSLQPAER